MEVMRTVVAPYLPGLMVVGALLFLVGTVVRLLLADTEQLIVWGNTIIRLGALVLFVALSLWAIVWFMEAWASGVIEDWLDSWQRRERSIAIQIILGGSSHPLGGLDL